MLCPSSSCKLKPCTLQHAARKICMRREKDTRKLLKGKAEGNEYVPEEVKEKRTSEEQIGRYRYKAEAKVARVNTTAFGNMYLMKASRSKPYDNMIGFTIKNMTLPSVARRRSWPRHMNLMHVRRAAQTVGRELVNAVGSTQGIQDKKS